MGYFLQAFICKQEHKDLLTLKFKTATVVYLGQDICLIPMTESLYDEINQHEISPEVEKFEYLTENVEQRILDAVGQIQIAYIEAEYFGGEGGQMGMLWLNKTRAKYLPFGDEKINEILREFGAKADPDKDEFLTLGFGLRRNTIEWC